MNKFSLLCENNNYVEVKFQELKSEFLYIFENNNQVGSMILTYEDNIAKVYSLYILEKHRGKGLSKKLMENAIHRAKQRGIKIMELNTEFNNDKANNLYKSLGFIKDGIFEGFNHYILKLS